MLRKISILSFEKSVGAVVYRVNKNGKIEYLVMQYRNFHWEFPRGHKEEGETDQQAAEREIFEETGMRELRMIHGFSENTYFYYTAKGNERNERKATGKGIYIFKKVIFFLAEAKTAEVKLSHEQLNFEWLEYDAALEKITYKNAKNVLRKAYKFLNIAKSKSFL